MTTKTLYRSKYALSEGKINAAKYEVSSEGYWRRIGGPYYEYSLKLGRDVHETAEIGISKHDGKTEYRVGQRVTPDAFNDNWTDECSNGVHFFITRLEAEAYQ